MVILLHIVVFDNEHAKEYITVSESLIYLRTFYPSYFIVNLSTESYFRFAHSLDSNHLLLMFMASIGIVSAYVNTLALHKTTFLLRRTQF